MKKNNFDPYDFSKKEIEGVPVYYKNLPWSPCIHIRIVFNVGAFNDPVGKEGLSHFLEHMLLKGCPSLPSKKAVKEWSKINVLNTLNAATYIDLTSFISKCLPEKYETVLCGLKDMIFNSYLKSEDIEEERKVITQELWRRFINEKYLNYKKEINSIVYYGNQFSRHSSCLGWPETILKISKEDIISWHKKNYGKGNFFIIITGAVEEEHISKLKDFLKDLPIVNSSTFDFGSINKPKQNKIIKTADEIGKISEQASISIIRLLRRVFYYEDEICEVSRKLISDLLYERLRSEHSLCYDMYVNISKEKLFTNFTVSLKIDQKNIDLAEKIINELFSEIINKKHLDRFNIIKKLYKEQIESQEFNSLDVIDEIFFDVTIFDSYIITQKERLDNLDKVTHDDVVKFISELYNPEYIFTEIILPSKK